MKSSGYRVGFAEADDDTGEDDLGADHQEVDQTGHADNDPAPAPLGIVVLEDAGYPPLPVHGAVGHHTVFSVLEV